MKRLSRAQVNTLITMIEGDIYLDISSNELSLEDADKNSYIIRRDTFKILLDNAYIKNNVSPSINIECYNLTQKAKDYLIKYHKSEIIDFL